MVININNLRAINSSKVEVSFLGKLLWFSLPEILISLPELHDVFKKDSIDEKFLPKPICARDAFRRATKLAESKKIRLDEERHLNLLVREISSTPDRIVRQMVREVVDSKNERLEYLPIVTFIQEKNDMDYQSHGVLYQEEQEAIEKVVNGFDLFKEKYTSQTVRAIVMDILETCSPVAVRPSGGVYFTPETYSDQVKNLQNLVTDLSPFCCDNAKTDFHTVPVIDVDEQRDMVNQSLEEQVKSDSLQLIDEIAEIIKSGRKVSQSTAVKYVEEVKALKGKVKEYEEMLETEIENVQETMNLALEAAKKLLDNAAVA